MASCVQCSSRIPEGQRTCSMCYGDPGHGKDGYYQDYLDRWEEAEHRARDEREEQEQE